MARRSVMAWTGDVVSFQLDEFDPVAGSAFLEPWWLPQVFVTPSLPNAKPSRNRPPNTRRLFILLSLSQGIHIAFVIIEALEMKGCSLSNLKVRVNKEALLVQTETLPSPWQFACAGANRIHLAAHRTCIAVLAFPSTTSSECCI